MRHIFYVITVVAALVSGSAVAADDQISMAVDKAFINRLMDGFHDAAAKADKDRYLGYFTEDGVFMGTDDWERWPLNPQFKKYVTERFRGGKGWVYKSMERNIAFSPDRKVAWFDEVTKSEKWGLFRGTGVLLKQGSDWKVAHYSMSSLVPNEVWVSVSDLNKAAVKRREADKK